MLITAPNLQRPDECYSQLIAAHEGLTEAESHSLNARLVLLLVNHIGDEVVLKEALVKAKITVAKSTPQPGNG